MKVAIIMGSTSDLDIMSQAINVLEGFGVEVVKRVISAHRTPDLMCEFAKSAKAEGIGVIIAGAGGAAHVAGVVAGMTTVPEDDQRRMRFDFDRWLFILSVSVEGELLAGDLLEHPFGNAVAEGQHAVGK